MCGFTCFVGESALVETKTLIGFILVQVFENVNEAGLCVKYKVYSLYMKMLRIQILRKISKKNFMI